MTGAVPHIPVMLPEVLQALQPKAGEVYVDGTFGGGGYTRGILGAADCQVVAIDRDETAQVRARAMQADGLSIVPVHGAFGDVAQHLQGIDIPQVDGFVLDLGVSSMQIDTPERGFSFVRDGALDMRMDTSTGESASELIARLDEKTLADIIFRYGEERHSRSIARGIVKARALAPITGTLQLADIVAASMPGSAKKYGINPATRTFQALRIAVNGELDQLEAALEASLSILKPGGRLVIVSFHSLEDAMVKRFLRQHAQAPSVSRHMPEGGHVFKPAFALPGGKAVLPGDDECAVNPRARSAKLRVAVRLDDGKGA